MVWEAIATTLEKAINNLHKTPEDPLIIEANEFFTVTHLSNIMKVLNQKKLPIMFQINATNSDEIQTLMNKYNQEFNSNPKTTHAKSSRSTKP